MKTCNTELNHASSLAIQNSYKSGICPSMWNIQCSIIKGWTSTMMEFYIPCHVWKCTVKLISCKMFSRMIPYLSATLICKMYGNSTEPACKNRPILPPFSRSMFKVNASSHCLPWTNGSTCKPMSPFLPIHFCATDLEGTGGLTLVRLLLALLLARLVYQHHQLHPPSLRSSGKSRARP